MRHHHTSAAAVACRGSSPACPRSRNLDAHCNFMEKNWCAQLMSGIRCPMWQHPDHGCGAHAEACTASCLPGRAFVCGEHARGRGGASHVLYSRALRVPTVVRSPCGQPACIIPLCTTHMSISMPSPSAQPLRASGMHNHSGATAASGSPPTAVGGEGVQQFGVPLGDLPEQVCER